MVPVTWPSEMKKQTLLRESSRKGMLGVSARQGWGFGSFFNQVGYLEGCAYLQVQVHRQVAANWTSAKPATAKRLPVRASGTVLVTAEQDPPFGRFLYRPDLAEPGFDTLVSLVARRCDRQPRNYFIVTLRPRNFVFRVACLGHAGHYRHHSSDGPQAFSLSRQVLCCQEHRGYPYHLASRHFARIRRCPDGVVCGAHPANRRLMLSLRTNGERNSARAIFSPGKRPRRPGWRSYLCTPQTMKSNPATRRIRKMLLMPGSSDTCSTSLRP